MTELHDVVDIKKDYTIQGDTLIALRDKVVDLYTQGDSMELARYLDQIIQEIT
jgi:hypothetical protein